jgi:CBS domain-containing protein
MNAADIMTPNVVTVTPDLAVQDLAALLVQNGISGVPVVDAAGKLLGIVSEGDLLHRAETGTERRTERRRSSWLDFFGPERDLARDYVKSHGHSVRDVMTRDVVAVTETTGVDEIANLLETNRIKRVPVVRDGKVVGIVSRANLVRALATAAGRPAAGTSTDDRAIREALLAELRGKDWVRLWASDIIVRDKVVHVWCSDDQSEEQLQALRVAAENTPGAAGVQMHIVSVPMTPPL